MCDLKASLVLGLAADRRQPTPRRSMRQSSLDGVHRLGCRCHRASTHLSIHPSSTPTQGGRRGFDLKLKDVQAAVLDFGRLQSEDVERADSTHRLCATSHKGHSVVQHGVFRVCERCVSTRTDLVRRVELHSLRDLWCPS